jgi:hypothetical protein
MKIRTTLISSLLAMSLAISGSAFAQAVNPGAEAQWQQFLSNPSGGGSGLV